MPYLAFGLTIETAINFNDLLQTSAAPTDVIIREGIVSEKAGQLTRVKRRGVQAKFGKTERGCVLNWEGIGKFKITDGNLIIYQNLGADEGTLRLFLLSEAIGIILYQRGLFLLHASAVKVGDKAIVFMGVGGAGKSTTATAFGMNGHTVLSDDLVAIQFIGSRPYIVPAFSQYKVWKSALNGLGIDFSTLSPSFEGADKFLIKQSVHSFPTVPIPLSHLTVLYRPTAPTKEGTAKPLRLPIELLKYFPLPVQLLTKSYLPQHFMQSLQIAQTTPLTFMKRPQDFQALRAFVDATGSRTDSILAEPPGNPAK